ncbi:hypothetical protein Tco_0128869 [Tanacetum coccineum]
MTTLADKSLLSGGDNKPPMLEKHLYDSWKSRMELYMMNRPHGRMILASVEKGPLVWPSITEDEDAINIILQGLPTEIYALVSQHRVAKDLWEKIKLLMQGTSLTKQILINLVHHNVYSQQPSIPQLEYAPTTYQQQQPEFSQPDSSLVVPVFQKGDDPIDAINHMMSFLTACHIPGHIAKQCTKPKRKRDETWFNDKVLLVQAQAGGQALTEEEIAFLADPGLPDIQTSQTVITHNAAYQADDLDAYDSDCVENHSAKIMTSSEQSNDVSQSETDIISDSNIIPYSHGPHCTTVNKALTTELDRYKEEVKELKEKQNVENSFLGSNEQFDEIARLKQNLFEQVQEKDCLMKTVSELKNDLN